MVRQAHHERNESLADLTLSLSKGERAQGWGNAAAFKLRWG